MTREKAAKKTTLQKELRAVIKASAELLDALDTAPCQVHEALNAAGRTLKDPKDPNMSVAVVIARVRILHEAAKAALAEQA
jgi:hypothetical protein